MNTDPNDKVPGGVAESATPSQAEQQAEFISRREAILKKIMTANEADDFDPSVCEDFDQIHTKGLYKVPIDGKPSFDEYSKFIEDLSSKARQVATAQKQPGLKTAYKKIGEYYARQLLKPVIKCQPPKRRAHVQALMKIQDQGDRVRAWEKTNESSGGARITAKMIRSVARELGIKIADPALTNSEKFTLVKRLYKPFRELFAGAAADANRNEEYEKFHVLLWDEESEPEEKSETPPAPKAEDAPKKGTSEEEAEPKKEQEGQGVVVPEPAVPQEGEKTEGHQVAAPTPEVNGDQKEHSEAQKGADPAPEVSQLNEESTELQVIPTELDQVTPEDGGENKTETVSGPEEPTTLAEEEYRRFIPKDPILEYGDLKMQRRPFVAQFMDNVYVGFSCGDQRKAFVDAGFPSLTKYGYIYSDTLWRRLIPFEDDALGIEIRELACAMLEANRKVEQALPPL